MAQKARNYTNPELRDRLKKKVMAGTKGGRAGQWSARKAQLLAQEYKAHGGGYTNDKPTAAQKHLNEWTEEKWQTADGKKARRSSGGESTTARYLPKSAWTKLSASEKKATDKKKRAGTKKGKQFVANTGAAKSARKSSRKHLH